MNHARTLRWISELRFGAAVLALFIAAPGHAHEPVEPGGAYIWIGVCSADGGNITTRASEASWTERFTLAVDESGLLVNGIPVDSEHVSIDEPPEGYENENPELADPNFVYEAFWIAKARDLLMVTRSIPLKPEDRNAITSFGATAIDENVPGNRMVVVNLNLETRIVTTYLAAWPKDGYLQDKRNFTCLSTHPDNRAPKN